MALIDKLRSALVYFKQAGRALNGKEIAVADTRYPIALGMEVFQYNPDELASRKGGLRWYDKMRHDEQVKACLSLKKAAIIGPGWEIAPVGDTRVETKLAERMRDDLLELSGAFEHDLWEMLSSFDYGFSITEKIFGKVDSRIKLTALKTRAPHDIDFKQDTFGNITSLRQNIAVTPTALDMDPKKFVHIRHAQEFSNPYGTSDLRGVYLPWWHKQQWMQWWVIYGEKLAVPPVVGKHPPLASDPTVSAVLQRLERLQTSTALTVPNDWDVELVESTRNPRVLFEAAVDRYDLAISRGLLLPDKSGLAGSEVTGGSYSLLKGQLALWFYIIEYYRKQVEAVLTEQLIEPMAQLEAPTVPTPKFGFLPLSEDNKKEIAESWIAAVTNKVVRNEGRDEAHFRKLLDFPEITEDEIRARDEEAEERRKSVPMPGQFPSSPGGDQTPASGGAAGGPPSGSEAGEARGPTPPHEGSTPPDAEVTGRRAPTKEERKVAASEDALLFAQGIPTKRDVDRTTPITKGFWRPLTFAEKRADMVKIRSQFEEPVNPLAEALAEQVEQIIADTKRAAKKAGLTKPGASAKAIRELKPLKQTSSSTQKTIKKALADGYDTGRKKAIGEIEASGAVPKKKFAGVALVGPQAQSFFQEKAFWITGVLEEEVLSQAKNTLFNSIKGDRTETQITFELDRALEGYLPTRDRAGKIVNIPARLETIARTNIAEAINEGRWATFTDPEFEGVVEAVMYSAVLDDRVRESHAAWDGFVARVDDPVWGDNKPPNGFNCRCTLIPYTTADDVELSPKSPPDTAADPGFK